MRMLIVKNLKLIQKELLQFLSSVKIYFLKLCLKVLGLLLRLSVSVGFVPKGGTNVRKTKHVDRYYSFEKNILIFENYFLIESCSL